MPAYNYYFTSIDKVVQSRAFIRYYETLQAEAPAVQGSSLADLKNLLERRAPGFTEETADKVLAAVFAVPLGLRRQDWQTLLGYLCRPVLIAVFHRCGQWSTDHNDLWNDVQWCFVYVVAHLDVTKRRERIAQKIYNDTYNRLFKERKREWVYAKSEQPADDPEKLPEHHTDYRDELDEYLDSQQESHLRTEAILNALALLRQSGRLSERDYLLLVATEVYGQTVANAAVDYGKSSGAAKKQRQRLLPLLADVLAERAVCKCPPVFEEPPFVNVEGRKFPRRGGKP